MTVKTDLGGEGVRRNYSICAPATRAMLRIAVKHIPGGAFSTFVAEQLKAGDVLEVMTPTGRFGTPLDPLNRKHYVAIVVGSGITPILSILQTVLELETDSRFTLIYGNRTKDSTMFRSELDELESRYADRLEILHVLSRDPHHTPVLRGRIDRDKLERWLAERARARDGRRVVPVRPDRADGARSRDADRPGRRPRAHPPRAVLRLRHRRAPSQLENTPRRPSHSPCPADGKPIELTPGDSILEAALRPRPDAPYACMGGACGTCRAKLLEGTVDMDHNYALSQADLDAGYVLTCQSHPTSPTVNVNYDA